MLGDALRQTTTIVIHLQQETITTFDRRGTAMKLSYHPLCLSQQVIPRQLESLVNKNWGVRLFGGETLIVLAE